MVLIKYYLDFTNVFTKLNMYNSTDWKPTESVGILDMSVTKSHSRNLPPTLDSYRLTPPTLLGRSYQSSTDFIAQEHALHHGGRQW